MPMRRRFRRAILLFGLLAGSHLSAPAVFSGLSAAAQEGADPLALPSQSAPPEGFDGGAAPPLSSGDGSGELPSTVPSAEETPLEGGLSEGQPGDAAKEPGVGAEVAAVTLPTVSLDDSDTPVKALVP